MLKDFLNKMSQHVGLFLTILTHKWTRRFFSNSPFYTLGAPFWVTSQHFLKIPTDFGLGWSEVHPVKC